MTQIVSICSRDDDTIKFSVYTDGEHKASRLIVSELFELDRVRTLFAGMREELLSNHPDLEIADEAIVRCFERTRRIMSSEAATA